ncbi:MafI family immunity protein [Kosakonia pseudosacchari]|uniref:MafI family immunity protein n=1 Tax=Kosakonia pseudosacchari TaxID=1646340 RepID=UPI0018828189|nr:MafI family immunity protein [Kosakonia pseudosacchari]QOV65259.1 MafI family immunity protein [Kosakonia pseudosacchari]
MSEGIKAFGARFAGRVDVEKLRFAIEYVDYGESGLAFETICDYIVEEDAPISEEEYHLAVEIFNDYGGKWGAFSIEQMKELIVKGDGSAS